MSELSDKLEHLSDEDRVRLYRELLERSGETPPPSVKELVLVYEEGSGTTPEALRASRLTPEELRILGNYWSRRSDLSLESRARVLPKLLAPVVERLGEPLPYGGLEAMEAWLSGELQIAARTERQVALDGLRRGARGLGGRGA